MKASTLALTLGATIRLTRFVVTDQLGEWLIHEPIDKRLRNYAIAAANGDELFAGEQAYQWSHEGTGPWWWRYREGLDCGWCVGYWVGVGVLAGSVLTADTRAEKPWRFLLGTLALNTTANAVAGLPSLDLYGMNHDED